MAGVFAKQGYLRQAARMYRRLLAQSPQRSDLAEALAGVERQIAMQKGPSADELGLLIRQWAELIEKQKKNRR